MIKDATHDRGGVLFALLIKRIRKDAKVGLVLRVFEVCIKQRAACLGVVVADGAAGVGWAARAGLAAQSYGR